MTRTMIAARQRTTRIDEPPVLFRLPNLRKRTVADDMSVASFEPSVASDIAFRVDPPEVAAPRAHQDLVSRPTAPVAVNEPVASPIATSHVDETPAAKGWMERIGSRLILIVTLIVIVSAAWVTGRRMPASKPGTASETALTRTGPSSDKEKEDVSALNPAPLSESVATVNEPLPETPSSDFSPIESANPLGEIETLAPANAPSAQVAARKPDISTQPQAALAPPANDTRTSVFSTASTPAKQVPSSNASLTAANSGQMTPTGEAAPDTSADFSLAPAQPLDNASSQSSSVTTATPNELTLDPSVLVPWALEQNKSHDHMRSSTPNPVVDWSQYLPSSNTPSPSSIRSVSATEPTGSVQPAQQALYPAGVNANPYNR
jgi:hypothetical protein